MSEIDRTHIAHAALRTDLDFSEIVGRFWAEVRPLAPQHELHVVDPYLLDAGRRELEVHAGNIAGLLKVLVKDIQVITLVHGREGIGVREALERDLRLMLRDDAQIRFLRPPRFHHRWIVADRARLASMDLSFNQIGDVLGGVYLVTSERDRADFCAALERQDPPDM